MSITRINQFRSAQDKEEELFAFLKSLVPYISSSEGCVSCEVLRNSDSQNNFVVLEKWDSIESHRKSVENFPKEEMQAAIPLLDAPPIGNYYHA